MLLTTWILCRAEGIIDSWDTLLKAATGVYEKLADDLKPAFFQLVLHPVAASANLGKMIIYAGMNAVRASQARLSTNELADRVEELFDIDYELESQYHSLLDGELFRFSYVDGKLIGF